MRMGWVLCERAVYEPVPWLVCVPIFITSGHATDALPRRAVPLGVARVTEIGPFGGLCVRVRKKSLYLRVSSDMNLTRGSGEAVSSSTSSMNGPRARTSTGWGIFSLRLAQHLRSNRAGPTPCARRLLVWDDDLDVAVAPQLGSSPHPD